MCITAMTTLCVACSKDSHNDNGSIVGYVTTYVNGTSSPLIGVTVTNLTTNDSVTTNRDGTFKFRQLTPQTYNLKIAKSGYNTIYADVDVTTNAQTDVSYTMTTEGMTSSDYLTVAPTTLDFGINKAQLSVTMKNVGTEAIDWTIDLNDVAWLTTSLTAGQIQPQHSQSVVIGVDRNRLDKTSQVAIYLHTQKVTYQITVIATLIGTEDNTNATDDNSSDSTDNSDTDNSNAGTDSDTPANSDGQTDANTNPDSGTGNNSGDENSGTDVVGVDNGTGNYTSTTNSIVVSTDLLSYYTFENNYDDTINAWNNATAVKTSFVSGISGKAVNLPSASSSLTYPWNFIHTRTFSLCFWLKTGNDGLIFHTQSGDENPRFVLSIHNGALEYIITNKHNTSEYNNSGYQLSHPTITDNQWHHIALVCDFSNTNRNYWTTLLYVDGYSADQVTEYSNDSYGEATRPTSLILGGAADCFNYTLTCGGIAIDNLRIYDTRTISANEVFEIYDARQ
jgi:hypothetical protein